MRTNHTYQLLDLLIYYSDFIVIFYIKEPIRRGSKIPVFDDVLAVLHEINGKLGVQAPERASILGRTTEVTQRNVEERMQKDQASNIGRAVADALNKLPVFNKLAAAMTGLAPIIREVAGAGIVASIIKGHGGTNAIASASEARNIFKKGPFYGVEDPQLKQVLDKGLGHRLRQMQKDINEHLLQGSDIKGPANPDILKRLQDRFNAAKEEVDTFHKNRDNYIIATYEAITKPSPAFMKLFAGKLGYIPGHQMEGGGLGAPMSLKDVAGAGGSIALTTTQLFSLLKIPGTLIGLGIAAVSLSKHFVDATRSMAYLNAGLATSFAISDIRTLFRDMASAGRRSGATSNFLRAWGDFADRLQPQIDFFINGLVNLGTALLDIEEWIEKKAVPAVGNAYDKSTAVLNYPLKKFYEWKSGVPYENVHGHLEQSSDVKKFYEWKNGVPYENVNGHLEKVKGASAFKEALDSQKDTAKVQKLAAERQLEAANMLIDSMRKEGFNIATAANFAQGAAVYNYEHQKNSRPNVWLDGMWKRHQESK